MSDESTRPDPAAFDAGLAELTPRLYAWVHLRLPGRNQDAEDVVQEALCRALARRDQFHGGSLAAWVFQITNNVLLEALRRSRRGPRLLTPAADASRGPFSEFADRATTLTRAVARRDDVRALLELARTFEEVDQRILLLCGLQGWTARQAADALGMGNEAVQKRWYRLRQRIQGVPWVAAAAES